MGTGFVLYYDFKKYLIYLLIIISLVVGFPCTVLNAIDNPGERNNTARATNFSGEISVGNIFIGNRS